MRKVSKEENPTAVRPHAGQAQDSQAQLFRNLKADTAKDQRQQHAEEEVDVFMRVPNPKKIENCAFESELAHQNGQVLTDLRVLGLCSCVVGLHYQVFRHALPSALCNPLNSGQGAGEHLAEERSTMEEVLIVCQVEVTGVAVRHRCVDRDAGTIEFVQDLWLAPPILWPNTFVLVEAIDDDAQDSGL